MSRATRCRPERDRSSAAEYRAATSRQVRQSSRRPYRTRERAGSYLDDSFHAECLPRQHGLDLLADHEVGRVVVPKHLAYEQLVPTAPGVLALQSLDVERQVVREVGRQHHARARLPSEAERKRPPVGLRLDRPVERGEDEVEGRIARLVAEAVRTVPRTRPLVGAAIA